MGYPILRQVLVRSLVVYYHRKLFIKGGYVSTVAIQKIEAVKLSPTFLLAISDVTLIKP
jgi:hypothetical protein